MEREQLTGVVIISLPDDPAKGKTITAFTLSDTIINHFPPPPPASAAAAAAPSPAAPPSEAAAWGPDVSWRAKRAIASVLGLSFLLFSVWVCLFTEAPVQLLSSPENDGRPRRSSVILPLYSKSQGQEITGGQGSSSLVAGVKLSSVSTSNSSAVIPIRGNLLPDGQYYTSLFVGNPPRPYFLDVDTGSDLTWIQCDAPCVSCSKGPHPWYKPTKSKIVHPKDSLCQEIQRDQNQGSCDSCNQCDYEIEYADRSSTMGVLARDELQLSMSNGDKPNFKFVFGCAYDQQGQFLKSPTKTDGILGLSSAKVSLPSQLASQGIINNVIGHCINSGANSEGYMFFGDDFVPNWGMTWVSSENGLTNFHQTQVLRINYGSKHINKEQKGGNAYPAIFDSGSTYSYFPDEAYFSLISSFDYGSHGLILDDSDPLLPVCWQGSSVRSIEDAKRLFEPLILHFGKRLLILPTTLTIPPEGYLIINKKGNVCLGILNGREAHGESAIILGDISLRGRLVVYDNVQRKIGFVESDCVKPKNPRNFPFLL
ncbi:Aspartic proteinase Asp1 [Apostasia shenzhenica]|uniref:Aspartic proteinase Asp1 n=1 Tax=Apostasia shenzhenica TaxID=1088818 RepID=A0A2I0BBH2_9ASPA|nr:Aspartic proteinase Asp1 [Apostasia shenzhenica]